MALDTLFRKGRYEKAFKKKFSSYTLYLMFDEDTQTAVWFGTNDTYVMTGTYSGGFSTGITISWDAGWDELFKYTGGSDATLIDGYGYEVDYKTCDVDVAQGVLDNLR